MQDKRIKKRSGISHLIGLVLVVLLILFYLSSVFLSSNIYRQVDNIQEHPFPVTTYSGKIESSVYQLSLLSERLKYIRSKDAIRSVKKHFEKIDEECTFLAQEVVDRYLTDPSEAVKMQKNFHELMDKEYDYMELCSNPSTTDAEAQEYIDTQLSPLMDSIQSSLDSIVYNATNKLAAFTDEAKEYRNFVIITCTILVVGVLISILIYLYIINKKEKEQEILMSDMEIALAASQTANTAKSRFLSSMSHDIRTPMNAIIGMTAIAGKNIQNPLYVKDCLEKISSSSKLLLGIINDVLDMSKIESGKIIINEEVFNLSDLFKSIVNIVRTQIKSKNQSLEVSISGVENEEVLGDALRLQQILVNILSNAVKFTPTNGDIKIKLLQESSIYSDYANYTFIISDNGIGMSEEFIKNIYNPFEREESSTTSKIEGTGLGLAIAKNMVEMMGGQISVESKLDVGTTFTVNIPFKKVNSNIDESDPILRDLRVLVVDDEQEICEDTVSVLNDLNMVGEWVLTGHEAVTLVVKNHKTDFEYHAVILDWKMPDMDGVETARQIRKAVGENTPIIILTAYDWSEIEEEAREAGVTAFLEKPLFKSRLKNTMIEVLQEEEIKEHDADEEEYVKSGRILIVEDNEINIEIIKTIIESFGIKTDVARDGLQAVEMVQALPEDYFDLILMDIKMPVMDGYVASTEIRKFEENSSRKRVPIIALSANAFADDIAKAKSVKMDDYLTKPINMERLKKMLDKYLD